MLEKSKISLLSLSQSPSEICFRVICPDNDCVSNVVCIPVNDPPAMPVDHSCECLDCGTCPESTASPTTASPTTASPTTASPTTQGPYIYSDCGAACGLLCGESHLAYVYNINGTYTLLDFYGSQELCGCAAEETNYIDFNINGNIQNCGCCI